MPSLEGMKMIADMNQQSVDNVARGAATFKDALQSKRHMEAAQQAADLWKSGDQKGAVAALIQADPSLAAQIASSAGADQAKFQTEKDYGQLPTQVAQAKQKAVGGGGFKDINLEGPDGSVIKAKMDKSNGKIYDLGGDPMDGTQLAGMKAGFSPTVRTNAYTKSAELISKGGKVKDLSESGAAVEQAPDGSAVALTPRQNEGITKETTQFNKDAKTVVEQINNGAIAKKMILQNTAGADVVEKLRLLKSAVGSGRVAFQEVQMFGDKQGVLNQIESAIAHAKGDGMGATEQQNMLKISDAIESYNMDEYNQLLHSHAAQVSGNYKVDPSIVVKRLAPTAPTVVQENLQKISKAPVEDQQAVDWAHQTLLSKKRTDPEYDKALRILKLHGL